MRLAVMILKREDFRYMAWCPALPGCQVLANSEVEAESKIRQVVESYLASFDAVLSDQAMQTLVGRPTGAA